MNIRDLRPAASTADVKCYHCGHISGQVVAPRGVPLRAEHFVPRRGYTGATPRPGYRLRCERCRGPVFLEETMSSSPIGRSSFSATGRKAHDGPPKAA